MSHHNSTPNTWFEQYFEDRLAEMEPYLRNWANTRYHTLDEATRDEALQRTRITLWDQYQAGPETWSAKSPRTWTQFAKTVYGHSLYNKKERVINRRFVCASDAESTQVRDGDTSILDLLNDTDRNSSQANDFHLAELRIDLELAIRRGMEHIAEADRDDMQTLMKGIMAGYTPREIAKLCHWSNNRAGKLNTLLRTVFYTALTGKERDPGHNPTSQPSEAELKRIVKLMDRGLGSYKIAACLGRTPSWALEHMTRIRKAQHESRDDLVRYATEELGAVLVEGRNWPTKRDGDNFASVAVGA